MLRATRLSSFGGGSKPFLSVKFFFLLSGSGASARGLGLDDAVWFLAVEDGESLVEGGERLELAPSDVGLAVAVLAGGVAVGAPRDIAVAVGVDAELHGGAMLGVDGDILCVLLDRARWVV